MIRSEIFEASHAVWNSRILEDFRNLRNPEGTYKQQSCVQTKGTSRLHTMQKGVSSNIASCPRMRRAQQILI